MRREWLVPVLRYLVAGLVGLVAGWLADRFGIEVSTANREFLTTSGTAIIGGVALAVSRWMKTWFLRGWHPGGKPLPEVILLNDVIDQFNREATGSGPLVTPRNEGPA